VASCTSVELNSVELNSVELNSVELNGVELNSVEMHEHPSQLLKKTLRRLLSDCLRKVKAGWPEIITKFQYSSYAFEEIDNSEYLLNLL